MSNIDGATEARFWANVRKGEGCWEWTAYRDRIGRGRFWLRTSGGRTRTVSAPRFSYCLVYGDPGAQWVHHSCDNPGCVRPDHLFVAAPTRRLSPQVVLAIREARADGAPIRTIADQFQVKLIAISRICLGQTYRDAGGPITRGMQIMTGKLAPAVVREIRHHLAAGETQMEISAAFGVSQTTISNIARGKTWRAVQ